MALSERGLSWRGVPFGTSRPFIEPRASTVIPKPREQTRPDPDQPFTDAAKLWLTRGKLPEQAQEYVIVEARSLLLKPNDGESADTPSFHKPSYTEETIFEQNAPAAVLAAVVEEATHMHAAPKPVFSAPVEEGFAYPHKPYNPADEPTHFAQVQHTLLNPLANGE
jgi:hypothetical protein